MTGEIMESILGKLNSKLSCTDRLILLLMDNAGCHPEYLKTKYSNIKICFLPANTMQPVDLGIRGPLSVFSLKRVTEVEKKWQ